LRLRLWDLLLRSACDQEGADWVLKNRRVIKYSVDDYGNLLISGAGPIHPSVHVDFPIRLEELVHDPALVISVLCADRKSSRSTREVEIKNKYLTKMRSATRDIDRVIIAMELMIINRDWGLWLVERELSRVETSNRVIGGCAVELRRASLMFGPSPSTEDREWIALGDIMSWGMDSGQRIEFRQKLKDHPSLSDYFSPWFR
jgi:hypothetical protein